MRIVGGMFKGRPLHPGKNFRSRPTTGLARESLFNILENRVIWEETDALDLFSGTGSIAIEMVSRGCRWVTSVEKDPIHAKKIAEVSDRFGISNLTVLREDVFRFLRFNKYTYSLVFADPPYDMKDFNLFAARVLNSGLLKEKGLFVLEHPGIFCFKQMEGFIETKKYSQVHFSFFSQ